MAAADVGGGGDAPVAGGAGSAARAEEAANASDIPNPVHKRIRFPVFIIFPCFGGSRSFGKRRGDRPCLLRISKT
jgi:hypothetical protein